MEKEDLIYILDEFRNLLDLAVDNSKKSRIEKLVGQMINGELIGHKYTLNELSTPILIQTMFNAAEKIIEYSDETYGK